MDLQKGVTNLVLAVRTAEWRRPARAAVLHAFACRSPRHLNVRFTTVVTHHDDHTEASGIRAISL